MRRFEPAALHGAGLLAGPANVVMQLALAPVGHGVAESTVSSGQLFRHPLKRTRTTLSYLSVALLGSDEDRRCYRSAVDRSHAGVHSGPASPVAYNAFDPDLQLWVAACLYVGLEDVCLRSGAELGGDFYRDAATLGTTLQVRPEQWPADRAAFARYWEAGVARISIDDRVRDYLDDMVLLRFAPRPWPALMGTLNRFITTGFLPPAFRRQMRYAWSDRDQRRFDALMSVVFAVDRRLPTIVRCFPFNALLWDVHRRMRAGRPLV